MTRRRSSSTRPGRSGTGRPSLAAAGRPRDRHLIGAVLLVLLGLGLIGDDRHVGLIADGRQMIRTAVALVETGELGQARGRDFTYERTEGDGVSRFGMATSLLQVPAAWAAPQVEHRFGRGSSQALFLVVPWLALGLAAGAAGAIARRLGGSHHQVIAAVLLASVASPLGSYGLLEFSEPVQAAALTLALAAALGAAQTATGSPRLEMAAGFAAGFAVLAKSSLLLAAPLTLLPLIDIRDRPRTVRSLLRAGAAAALPLAVWLGFEVARFGQLFGGILTTGSRIHGSTASGGCWQDRIVASCCSGRQACCLYGPAFGTAELSYHPRPAGPGSPRASFSACSSAWPQGTGAGTGWRAGVRVCF